MKQIFTIDDFIVAGISGIAYGLGFKIPQILGYEEWQCGLICFVIGLAVDKLTKTIVFNKTVQSSKTNRIFVFVGYILVCTAIEYAFMSWKEISIDDYAIESYSSLVLPAILGFVFSMIVRQYHIRKIRKRYGDGSSGFIFDDQLNKSDIEELNRKNQQIHGTYDTDCTIKTKTGVFVGQKAEDTIFFTRYSHAKVQSGRSRKATEPQPRRGFEKHFRRSGIQVDDDGSFFFETDRGGLVDTEYLYRKQADGAEKAGHRIFSSRRFYIRWFC